MFINNSNAVRLAYQLRVNKGAIGMANNTLRVSTPVTPKNKGWFRRIASVKNLGVGSAAVYWSGAMAQYLNRGRRYDGTHVIKRWTTPGTGAGFVEKGLKDTQSKYKEFFT